MRAGAGLHAAMSRPSVHAVRWQGRPSPVLRGRSLEPAVAPVIQGLLGDLARGALGARAQGRVGEAAIYAFAEIRTPWSGAGVSAGGALSAASQVEFRADFGGRPLAGETASKRRRFATSVTYTRR